MSELPNERYYLDLVQLIARTGLSKATIHRLKRAGKIPFYQPNGKGGKLLFPPDAVECVNAERTQVTENKPPNTLARHLSGPQPKWRH